MALMTTTRPKYRKRGIPGYVRVALAERYGVPPGGIAYVPCHYCGTIGHVQWWTNADGSPRPWVTSDHEMDHVIPEFKGGPTTADNLVYACRPCNRRKGHR